MMEVRKTLSSAITAEDGFVLRASIGQIHTRKNALLVAGRFSIIHNSMMCGEIT